MELFNGDFEIIQLAPGWPGRKDACLSIPSAGMKVHKVSACTASPPAPVSTFDIAFCFLNSKKKFSILSTLLNLLKLPSRPVVNAHGYHVIWTHVSCYHDCKFCIFTLYINNHIALYPIQMFFKFIYYICLISFRAQWWVGKTPLCLIPVFLQISPGCYWHGCYFILNTGIKLLICLLYIKRSVGDWWAWLFMFWIVFWNLLSVYHTLSFQKLYFFVLVMDLTHSINACLFYIRKFFIFI